MARRILSAEPEAAPSFNLAGFDEDSITNGPGLRFVLFVQGCPHHCPGCHNPETHEFGVGCDYPAEILLRRIRGNPLQTGVTFSGGEPFCQSAACAALGRRLKAYGYDLAAYSGYTFEQLLTLSDPAVRDFLEVLDVLVDGPFLVARRDILLHFRGSDNQRILNVPESLRQGRAVISTAEGWTAN